MLAFTTSKKILALKKIAPLIYLSQCRLFGSGTAIDDPLAQDHIKKYVLNYLKEGQLTIFSRQNDEFGQATKELLDSSQIPYQEVLIENMDDEDQSLSALIAYTSQK